jgi:dolichol-phosphate mannosyltransferase
LPEKSRFLRGLFAWVGFPQTAVRYSRDSRLYGKTKYPLWKMLKFAWQGISAFSLAPIRFVTLLGIGVSVLSFSYLIYALIAYIHGQVITGWTTIVVLQSFLGGCILLAIGIVGEYIGKIVEEVKGRPVYIKYQEFSSQKNNSDEP